jgi:hypothetical protein
MICNIWIDVPGFAEGPAEADFFLTESGPLLDTLTLGGLELSYEQAEALLGKVELKRVHRAVDWSDFCAAHAVDARASREEARHAAE